MNRFNFTTPTDHAHGYENPIFSGSRLNFSIQARNNVAQLSTAIVQQYNRLKDPQCEQIKSELQNRLRNFIETGIEQALCQPQYKSIRDEILINNDFQNLNSTFIFGSVACGIGTLTSDIDLAINIPRWENGTTNNN